MRVALIFAFTTSEKWKILTTLSENDRNPKLVALKQMILKAFDEEPDTYAILFTRTKNSTEALKSWVNEDPDMGHIGALRITGTSSEDTAGSFALYQVFFPGCFVAKSPSSLADTHRQISESQPHPSAQFLSFSSSFQ